MQHRRIDIDLLIKEGNALQQCTYTTKTPGTVIIEQEGQATKVTIASSEPLTAIEGSHWSCIPEAGPIYIEAKGSGNEFKGTVSIQHKQFPIPGLADPLVKDITIITKEPISKDPEHVEFKVEEDVATGHGLPLPRTHISGSIRKHEQEHVNTPEPTTPVSTHSNRFFSNVWSYFSHTEENYASKGNKP